MISQSDIDRLTSRSAVEQLVDTRYDGDPGRFVADVNSSMNRLLHADLEEAHTFLKSAAVCFRFLPNRFKPRLKAMRARYAHWTGNSGKALGLYRQAVDSLLSEREFEAAAQTRLGLLDVCMYLGRYDEALEQGRKALAYFRRKNDRVRMGRTLTNIGNVYHRLDRNTMAMRYYDRAREQFKTEGGVPLAIVDYNRANIYANLNKIDQAERLYRSVAETLHRNNISLVATKAEYSLAYLHFLADRYTDALRGFEHVLDEFTSGGYEKEAAVTRLDLAEMNIYLNQFGSALALGREVMEDFGRRGMRYEQAKASYFVAEAHRRLGDFSEAGAYLRRADSLFEREGNALWQGMVKLERSRLYLTRGRYTQAVKEAERSRRLFRKSDDRRRIVDAEIVLVEAYLKSDLSARGVQRAERLLGRTTASYQQYGLLNLLGRHYLSRDDPKTALSYLKRAIDVVEKMLVDLYPDEIRHFFVMDKCDAYYGAAECLLKLNRVRDSFLHHSQALTVLNRRHVPESILRDQVPGHLLETRAALRASLKKLSRAPDPGQRSVADLPSAARIEQRLWANEMKIRSHIYPSGGETRPRVPEIDIGPDRLRRDEALIHYVVIDDKVGAYRVTPAGTEYKSCDVSPADLERNLRELHFLMENAVYARVDDGAAATIEHYLQRLYDHMIRPLDLPERTQRLILLVDGLFAQLPFVALTDSRGGACLKDRYDIQVIVNPEDLAVSKSGSTGSLRTGSVIFAPSSAELPLIDREGDSIKEYFPRARHYRREAASGDQLRRELARAEGFVHIAAHAARSSENPLFSQILMSDGPFYPFDLFGTGIRAQLVTLSGCQTAAPGVYYGNSFSLAKIFYQSGARHVLASLWPVSDKVSMVFMSDFYRALRQTSDIAASYKAALDTTSSMFINPAHWAQFVLVGI